MSWLTHIKVLRERSFYLECIKWASRELDKFHLKWPQMQDIDNHMTFKVIIPTFFSMHLFMS